MDYRLKVSKRNKEYARLIIRFSLLISVSYEMASSSWRSPTSFTLPRLCSDSESSSSATAGKESKSGGGCEIEIVPARWHYGLKKFHTDVKRRLILRPNRSISPKTSLICSDVERVRLRLRRVALMFLGRTWLSASLLPDIVEEFMLPYVLVSSKDF